MVPAWKDGRNDFIEDIHPPLNNGEAALLSTLSNFSSLTSHQNKLERLFLKLFWRIAQYKILIIARNLNLEWGSLATVVKIVTYGSNKIS